MLRNLSTREGLFLRKSCYGVSESHDVTFSRKCLCQYKTRIKGMLTHILITLKKKSNLKKKTETFPKNKINMKVIKYDAQPLKMYDILNS
jgi:hypothetical protein